jgi:hypothetical protein
MNDDLFAALVESIKEASTIHGLLSDSLVAGTVDLGDGWLRFRLTLPGGGRANLDMTRTTLRQALAAGEDE